MTKKSTYFSILVAAIIISVAGVLLNIKPIVSVLDTMRDMVNEWPIWVLALICGIVFLIPGLVNAALQNQNITGLAFLLVPL